MSDTVAVALITGGSTGLVGLAALAFNFWNSSRERRLRLDERREDYKEWYGRNLFERRIEAAQGAIRWFRELDLVLPHVRHGDNSSKSAMQLRKIAGEVRDWLQTTSFHLPDDISDNLWGFLNNHDAYLLGIPAVDQDLMDNWYFPARFALDAFVEELRAHESSLQAVRGSRHKHVMDILKRFGILDTSEPTSSAEGHDH